MVKVRVSVTMACLLAPDRQLFSEMQRCLVDESVYLRMVRLV